MLHFCRYWMKRFLLYFLDYETPGEKAFYELHEKAVEVGLKAIKENYPRSDS